MGNFEMGDWGHGGLSEIIIGEMPDAAGVVQKKCNSYRSRATKIN